MKNLAIIGASYLQLPLIEKAKKMGYTTHVFAWQANDVGEYAADFFYPISITKVDAITEECRKLGVCGVCSIATDLGNYTVNYVANKLNLPCNSMESTLKSTNKHLMRQAFNKRGDPCPKSVLVDSNTDISTINISFPAIVKPTDRSGSRGVVKLTNREEMHRTIKLAIEESFEKKALLEEYIEGKEYSVEGLSYKGEHHILAITEKFTTGPPHFIETGHREPATLDYATYNQVVSIVLHALDTLEIENSASHSEIKINEEGQIKIIEIGARMGGDCIGSDLVFYSTGIDYLKATIQVACGQKPLLVTEGEKKAVEVRFILTEDDLIEFERIKEYEPKRIVRIVDDKHLDLLGQTTDSSNRAGCYILWADKDYDND